MNNKIIKTLNSIKSYINQYENEGGDLSIPFDKWKLLLDYITNLQELYDKALTDLVKESHKNMKAIEYVNNTIFWGVYEDIPMIDTKYGEDLSNILQGEDK